MDVWHKALMVIITSATPVSELRGAIPLGVSLGFTPLDSLLLSLVGNLLIIPPVLWLIEPLFTRFKRLKSMRGWISGIEAKTAGKMKHYREYRLLGLFLLVAVPLPGTGAYTGCLAARLLKISMLKSWAAISLGVLVAGGLIYLLTSHVAAWL